MSTRRRFKVAASIPVRRKPQPVDVKPEAESDDKCVLAIDAIETGTPTQELEDRSIEIDASTVCVPPPTSPDKTIRARFIKPAISAKLPSVQPSGASEPEDNSLKLSKPSIVSETAVLADSQGASVSVVSATEETVECNRVSLFAQKDEPPKTDATTKFVPLAPPLTSPIKTSRSRFIRPALSARRASVHASSASESEDDSLRLSKVPKVSETLITPESQAIKLDASEVSGTEEVAECARLSFLPKKKAKVSNFVRKVAEARREFKRKFAECKPDRSNLKMFDLIFYNPSNSPMNKSPKSKSSHMAVSEPSSQNTALEEEEVDNPEELAEDGASTAPVPQVKIGANGEIILDEKSLVIETTASKAGREALEHSVPILEEGKRKMSYYGRKQSSIKEWTPVETKIFYRALNCLGTDFALMNSIFPDRTRAELKNKFKREERNHMALVDRALSKPGQFNVKLLLQEADEERKRVHNERQRQLEEKVKLEQERKMEREAAAIKAAERPNVLQRLMKFVDAEVEADKFARAPRRPRRATRPRYLPDDFVDPFSTTEESMDKPHDSPLASVNLEDTCKPVSSSSEADAAVPANRPKKNVRCRNLHEESVNITNVSNARIQHQSCEEDEANLLKKNTVFKVTAKARKIMDNADLDNVDTESVVSCLSIEDIPAEEFVELLQENIDDSGRATIRVEDSPSDKSCAMQVILASGPGKKKRRLRVVQRTSDENADEEHNFTINEETTKAFQMEDDFTSNLETIFTLKPLSATSHEPDSDVSVPHATMTVSIEESQGNSIVDLESVCHNQPTLLVQEATLESVTGSEFMTHGVDEHGPASGVFTEEIQSSDKLHRTEELFSNNLIYVEHGYAKNGTDPSEISDTDNVDQLLSNVTSTHDLENSRDENDLPTKDNEVGLAVRTDSEVRACSSQTPKTSPPPPVVNLRITNGFEYAHVQSDSSLDHASLSGLKPGSFVLMTTTTPHSPQERKCSMYMVAEKLLPDGSTVPTPMPVVLPPELVSLILSEIDCVPI